MDIQKNIDLKKWNTWKVGGVADFFCLPKSKKDILEGLKWAKKHSLPVYVLGGGTNVLISDQGVRGLVMNVRSLKGLKKWEEQGCLYISSLAGVSKAELMRVFLSYRLAPALFLCGLPGDVGGGVVMNAGIGTKNKVSPREFKDIVDWVKVLRWDGEEVLLSKEKIRWGYRYSEGLGSGIIYKVGISWSLKPLDDLPVQLKKMALRRADTQPLQSASCGSVFKNPVGYSAGRLIEECGLKGFQVGGAQISNKHANFILNTGSAKALDIYQLILHVQQTVKKQHGILLEPEVKYLGFRFSS